MKKIAFVFPGQGTQFVGMGLDLYKSSGLAKKLFNQANDILGFNLTEVMFNGSEEELCQTEIAQLAIFSHSYVLHQLLGCQPDMVSGHSLGIYSALAAAGALNFADALRLVRIRAQAMRSAGVVNPGTMAAILSLVDSDVERICSEVKAGYVTVANYNCTGQQVISGTVEAVAAATKQAKREGAHRVILLRVSGAFHSALMEPAQPKFAEALDKTLIYGCKFPVYSDLDGNRLDGADNIRKTLLRQLVSPVRWPIIIQRMIADGADEFVEVGPGSVLQGMIKRINKNVKVFGVNDFLEAKSNGISNS